MLVPQSFFFFFQNKIIKNFSFFLIHFFGFFQIIFYFFKTFFWFFLKKLELKQIEINWATSNETSNSFASWNLKYFRNKILKMSSDEVVPNEIKVIQNILESMGVKEYEPRVPQQLLEFIYRKTTKLNRFLFESFLL